MKSNEMKMPCRAVPGMMRDNFILLVGYVTSTTSVPGGWVTKDEKME